MPGGADSVNPSGVMTAMRCTENVAFEFKRVAASPRKEIQFWIDNAPARIESIDTGTVFR